MDRQACEYHRCKVHSSLHERVLTVEDLTQGTYFRPDPDRPGYVTMKTTVEQETACFIDDGTNVDALEYLRTLYDVLPTHLIEGSRKDIW